MTPQGLHVDLALVEKYNVAGPRYTSYPPATVFAEAFDEAAARAEIAAGNRPPAPVRDLSLYFHLPFCETLCWFCGCTTVITLNHERGMGYVEALGREVEAAVGGDVVRTSDCVLSINGLKALVRRLALLVTTDTGPRHFAVGFDVPYVCVMGSTDPMMTDQPESRGEIVRRDPLLDCMPCHEKVCPLQHHKCLEDIAPAQVLAAVGRVMALPSRPLDGASAL